jgi:hypothetical protein
VPTDLELQYPDEGDFLDAFERLAFPASRFRHRDHVRTAWAYVSRLGPEEAEARVTTGIRRLARAAGAEARYHETLTRGWVRAVSHFVSQHPTETFDEFVEVCPQLCRKDLLLAHYHAVTLASAKARATWVLPDKSPIP